ncbi:hypothetical protein A2W45_01070 [Candidatus Curtissbacteria bacterium RIFCSPHIGHO2_12_41_11]|uniref:Uncharacterized protein n=3 Tax=Candidatus Curtissiibacteriota TaxID=1752717 RepID=A0A1F5HS06_9BACT|nr:MAG: hypothetical protein UU56_C0016G0014 [Candidatus Curtissbacteria bacterium GW2011_GWA2_41_24]OGD99341.1 MAG: hypothetical protein A2W45_01070 [Candidatus Curtissbacteria bacterium RIFCSPHIGHO2_12_41_11]OGE06863.1 MAG: hypothetical protein A2W70_01520 [Candidatus Curtissbacteria bacterium RIFCSPLOWO2_02_41_11]
MRIIFKLLIIILFIITGLVNRTTPLKAFDQADCAQYSHMVPDSESVPLFQQPLADFTPPVSPTDPLFTDPGNYKFKIDGEWANWITMEVLPSGETWRALLPGFSEEGRHYFAWWFVPNTLPPTPAFKCGEYSYNVVESTSFGTSGKNPCTGAGCETALGNIPTSVGGFAQRVLNIAIGLAGGIALILMVIGSIRVLTSSGDQQKLAGGRDMIVAAIAGLLFLIFSFLILRFIGVTLFGAIPSF